MSLPLNGLNRSRELLQKAGQPASFESLLTLVRPRIRIGKKNLIYVLKQVDRIGQLSSELLHIKTLYESFYDRIIIVTGPTNDFGVNLNVFKVVGSKFIHVSTEDPVIPMIGLLNAGITQYEDIDLLIVGPWKLWSSYKKAVTAGLPLAAFQLPNSLRLKGEAWMAKAGLDPATPVVLLHARDIGYRPDLSHHGHRCVDIENYRGAISFLENQGYQVVRLGDKTNQRLKGYTQAVIDLPFHPDYDPFLDIYFAATCCFAMNQSSGPMSLVRAFKKPALMVNRTVDWDYHPGIDCLMFKHYKNKTTGKELSYDSILETGLGELSVDEDFEKAGIIIEENTPNELEQGIKEFVALQHGKKCLNSSIQELFFEIGKKHQERISTNPDQYKNHTDIFGLGHKGANVSEEFVNLNPTFFAN
jgi:putative glycosyltransferase (TIGR04372 family)